MNFDQLVDRLTSLYDVGQTRAVDAANERLSQMAGQAKSLRKLLTITTTVADQHEYAIPAAVVEIYRVTVSFSTGDVIYKGTESLDSLLDLAAGNATDPTGNGYWYATVPDTDDTQTTENLYLWPAPSETGKNIVGRCAVLPSTLTYGSSTALPIPLDLHRFLLAGCKAELCDEEDRQDEAAKFEQVFADGINRLSARYQARATGSDRHRMRVAGYDISRWP